MDKLTWQRLARFALLLAITICPMRRAAAADAVDETRATDAALRAVVQHWSQAETDGDTAYLEQLLLPEYRSVDSKGMATPKAKIVDRAKRNQGSDRARHEAEAYRRTHPTEISVVIHGPIGVVSYFNPARGAQSGVRSSDVFVYEGQRWHAIYSQHSEPEPPRSPID